MYTLGVEPILLTLPSIYWLIIWRWNKSALVHYDSLFTIQLLDKIVPCSKPGNKEPLIEASIGQGQISPSDNHLLLLSKNSRHSQELWLHHALSPLQNCRERSFLSSLLSSWTNFVLLEMPPLVTTSIYFSVRQVFSLALFDLHF